MAIKRLPTDEEMRQLGLSARQPFEDVSGHRFGMLTAIRRMPSPRKPASGSYWEFRCDCGNTVTRSLGPVRQVSNQSCGCGKATKALSASPAEPASYLGPDPRSQVGKPQPYVLRRVLSYNPETGALTWNPRTELDCSPAQLAKWNIKHAGKPAFGTLTSQGYLSGMLFNKQYKAHAVAWAIHHGYWPTLIDHVNRDRTDNRLANLRDVPHNVNVHNSMPRSSTGFKGVRKRGERFVARIRTPEKLVYLGTFDTAEQAAAAYDHGAMIYHGPHSFRNFPAE